MKKQFLEKFFPTSGATNIRKEIYGISQITGETFHEYWERFKRLCASFPHHQILDQLLIQYFNEGLLPMDRSMVDAASGGALVNKTPTEARQLISSMAENSQPFGTRGPTVAVQAATKSEVSDMRSEMSELTKLVGILCSGQVQAKACGLCFYD